MSAPARTFSPATIRSVGVDLADAWTQSSDEASWSDGATLCSIGNIGYQQEEIIVPSSDPVGWRGIVYGTRVSAAGGATVGTVREVLGSDSEDIFHGLRVGLAAGHRDVMIPADDVTLLSTDDVGTDLSLSAIEALATYDETATYHLASVGWLRKHLGWKKDAEGDEGPG
jgi:hypothetical protein